MKKLFLVGLSLIIFSVSLKATDFQGTKNAAHYVMPVSGNPYYAWGSVNIGRLYDSGAKEHVIARTRYTFDLRTIPSNAIINSVSLSYNCSGWGNSYQLKIKEIQNYSTPQTIYSGVYNGTTLFDNVDYNSSSLSSEDLTTLVNTKKSTFLYLGAMSNNEVNNDSYANLDLTLNISFEIPASNVTFYIDNNFIAEGGTNHGIMFVDGQITTIPLTKLSVTRSTQSTLNLGAISRQNNNQNHQMIWHTGAIVPSNWTRDGASRNPNQNYPITVQSDDNGSTYLANLRKNYRIDQNHKFEFGSDLLQPHPDFIVEQNSDSITAPLTSTSGNKTGNFSFWTDGITTRTRNVTLPTDNQTYTAFYKLNNYASSTTSYDKDGQKKSLMPWGAYDSGNWKVYESSGQIWLEKNGVVVNGGLPVNNLSEGPEAKSPSMDFVILSNWYSNIFVVYQQKTSNGKYKIKLAKFNGYGQKIYTYDVFTSTIDYNTFDAAPVISVTRNPDQASGKTKFNIVWCQKSEGSYQNGLYFYSGMDNGTNITWYYYPAKVSSTDASSSNPTMTVFKSPKGTAFLYHLAWQQGTTKIKYRAIADNWNGSTTGGVLENGSIEEPSYGDGWETNIEPSIAVLNNGTGISYGVYYYDSPKLVWKSDYAVTHRSKTTSSWGAFYNYYANDDISSANISAAIEEQTYVITWAELVGYYNRYIKSTNLSSQIAMGTHSKDIQVSNYGSFEWGFDINVFNNMTGTSAPFSFQTFSVQDGLSKANNFIAKEGRFGTVMKNEAEFYFGMGDLIANNNLVRFVELNDTLVITTNDLLNTYLLTEPFEVNNNGSFTYSIIYGVKDSLSAFTNLSSTENISFKVELIDNISNDVLGVFDQVVQSKNNLVAYENLSYQVNTTGIGNRTVRVRLVVNPNFSNTNYSLSKIFSDGAPLSKSKINEVNWRGLNTVDSYDLEQNFPNPFNPSTTIRYQIPQDGIVTLKIYDVLGSEVATLVNEEKIAGKYDVNFNASSLASGVYIFKIQSGSFINSKKMILIK